MREVHIEHRIGDVLGVSGRGYSGDADLVRSGKPEHLVAALDEMISALKTRSGQLQDSDPGKSQIVGTTAVLTNAKNVLTGGKFSQLPLLLLWEMSANLAHWAHTYLAERGL